LKKIDPIRAFQAQVGYSPATDAMHNKIEAAYKAQKFRGAPPANWLAQLARLLKNKKMPRFAHLAGGDDRVLKDLLDGGDAAERKIIQRHRNQTLLQGAKVGGVESGISRKDRGEKRATEVRNQFGHLHTGRQIGKAYALKHAELNSPEYLKLAAKITRWLRRHKVAP